MSLALNKPKLDNLADEIWKSAERLRGKFKAYEYQNVILPIIVIRRLECVLISTLTAYRKPLIHECVTGQRRVTEADVARSKVSAKTVQTADVSHLVG